MKTRSSIPLLFLLGCVAYVMIPAGAGSFISGSDSRQAAARFFPKDKLMEIGVYYYPEHWPEAEWDRDLANIASLGFSFVHMAEFSWAFIEPKDGRFDFAWLDRVLGLSAKHGLKVILGTPTAAPPAWLAQTHPEIFLQDGRYQRKEHGIRANYSTSNPVFRRYAERIVAAMAKRYGRDNRVWGWQIDNEPGAPFDYGPDAQARFRDWLKNKYGTIEKLNEVWGTAFWSIRYDSFAQVRIPNAALAGEDKLNPHAVLDHKRFNADEMADFLDMQAAALRKAISSDQHSSASVEGGRVRREQIPGENPGSLPPWVTTNYVSAVNEADPRRTRGLDFAAFTMYLLRGLPGLGPDGFRLGAPVRLAWADDFYRPLGGATGVMELQPGQINWVRINPQPLPGAVRMWLWHAFAGGCSFACTYRYRHIPYGSEQYHDGIVGLDGTTLSAGGLQFKQIIAEMAGLRAKYDARATLPPALRARRAALVWNHENLWDLEEQKQTVQWNTREHTERYFAALKSCGSPVDIVAEKDDLSSYAVVIAPAYQLVDENLLAKWKAYAENGGHLVLTCRTGQKDRTGRMWTGKLSAPIVPLIGADIAFYDMLYEDGRGHVALTGARAPFPWNNWAEVLEPAPGTETLAHYADQFYAGRAAATCRKLGRGTVTYVGTDTDDGRLEREIVRRVYRRAGIGIADLPEGVYVEWRDGFFIALSYSSTSFTLPLPAGAVVLIGDKRLDPAGVCVWAEK